MEGDVVSQHKAVRIRKRKRRHLLLCVAATALDGLRAAGGHIIRSDYLRQMPQICFFFIFAVCFAKKENFQRSGTAGRGAAHL